MSGPALLVTRAAPKPAVAQGFDDWQFATHLPDLMRAPGTDGVFYGISADGPAAVTGTASRLAVYSSPSLADMMTFVASSEVAEAVADGSRWFGQFNDLDGLSYSGNVYDVTYSAGSTIHDCHAILVERLEILEDNVEQFDAWVAAEHVPALERSSRVVGVTVCQAVREGVAVPHYYSRGSRAILTFIRPWRSTGGPLDDDAVRGAVGRCREWDLLVPYAEREVFIRAAVLPSTRGHGRRTDKEDTE